MTRILVFFLLILPPSAGVWAQLETIPDYGHLTDLLENEIAQGNKRALRDLASLLDKPEVNGKVRQILSRTTFFTPGEIDVNQCSALELLGFYYDNEPKIKYSEWLRGFYLTPLEARKTNFELVAVPLADESENAGLVYRYSIELDAFLTAKKFMEADSLMDRMTQIEAPNKTELLTPLLNDDRLMKAPLPLRNGLFEKILSQLAGTPSLSIVEAILRLRNKGILSDNYSKGLLENITNCAAPAGTAPENITLYYRSLIDSLETLENIREYGYDQIFGFDISFFQFPVDYYGKVLSLSAPYPWIRRNALLDLKRSNHPRALFYIAADYYKTRKKAEGYPEINHLQMIQSRINVTIGVENKDRITTFHPEADDQTALFNYLVYWASSYNDYEWDENRQVFTSRLESLSKTQNYERLFRRFNSKSDSIAMLAFLQLTEGDPFEILPLSKKYRNLLRNHNSALPSMKYQYLEQLSMLTDFCRKHKIKYKPGERLLSKLEKLATTQNEKERYSIENQVIRALSVSEVTAFEYWVLTHAMNNDLSLSAGRILDWFYSKNWKSILEDQEQLRLFLKKSHLFAGIGVQGVCNNYLNKFDLSDNRQLDILNELVNTETDKEILDQVLLLLGQAEGSEPEVSGFRDFIEAPLGFSNNDLKALPGLTISEMKATVDAIRQSNDLRTIKKLLYVLQLQPNHELTPELFRLVNENKIVVENDSLTFEVAHFVIPVIENIYAHQATAGKSDPQAATDFWRSLWEKDSLNYQSWGTGFFLQKLNSLETKEQLTIDEINQLTESPFYTENHKPAILEALKKVKPVKNIRRLSLPSGLSVSDDLKYFDCFVFTYKDLDDIPRLFEINNENAEKMLDFLMTKADSFNFSELGSFYNNLLRAPWMSDFISSKKLPPGKAEAIKTALRKYLNESSFLSEFEEQATVLNIATLDNSAKSLPEKLIAVFQLDADRESKAKIIEEIIATISYKEIGEVLIHFDQISHILGDKSCNFFHRDFGLPIFGFNNQNELHEMLERHQNLSAFDFYVFCLKKFGIDFLNEKGELDFVKIHDILQFDIVSPFTSEGKSKRETYVYGIVKLLEIRFGTRLGFHEKLNESQTFYSFSSAGRAEAWMDFLRQNNLVNHTLATTFSFSFIKKEMKTISENSANKD